MARHHGREPLAAGAPASELIAYAKARPGKVSFGSAGNGAPSHLSVELLKSMTQIDVVHIPYKGMAPALTDVIGGQIQFSIPTIAGGLPLSRAGKLRALAVTGAQRSPAEPAVPTVAESGVPGYQARTGGSSLQSWPRTRSSRSTDRAPCAPGSGPGSSWPPACRRRTVNLIFRPGMAGERTCRREGIPRRRRAGGQSSGRRAASGARTIPV